MGEPRKCDECQMPLPPTTEHYYDEQEDKYYHITCLDPRPYTAYSFYDMKGNYVGDSEHINKVEDYEDEYEEEDSCQ